MDDKWLESAVSQGVRGGKMTFSDTMDALKGLNVTVDATHTRSLFKERDPNRTGSINFEAFKSIYKTFVYRKELVDIFTNLAIGKRTLPVKTLLDFLQTYLYEDDANEQTAAELIGKYEVVEEARKGNCMTFEGFVRFMNSQDNYIFRRELSHVYQDMTQPLNDYFISTSHNTYLLSDQLVGQSHLWAYGNVLMRGCRCVEIDCWDGAEDEPIVYHGFTLTSKILFKTVIYVIEKYAFAALKYKILIKYKKIGLLQDTVLNQDPSKRSQVGLCQEEMDDDESGDEESPMRLLALKLNIVKKGKQPKSKQKKANTMQHSASLICPDISITLMEMANNLMVKNTAIAMALSDLVIYTKSVKLISFQHSRMSQKFYENNSLSEKQAQRLAQQSAQEFIHHNINFITRIYPKGLRAASSNFYPQDFWNVGCQMVALNFQTPGIPMDLQNGKFLDNGRCGFVLKPDFLRRRNSSFHPDNLKHTNHPMFLSIKVISGFLLPPGSLSKSHTADPVVTVEIYGIPADQCSIKTQVRKNNALNPQWNQSFTFSVQVPDLALLRFCVEDQLSLMSNEFLGQCTVPLTSINRGFRHVPLQNKHGQSMAPASLFVYIWYE